MTFAGGIDTITLTVDPYDGTTAATVAITGPTGQVMAPTAVSSDSGHTWSATPAYDATGKWVAKWTIAGTGEGETYQEIWVSRVPVAAAVVGWRPERWDVAAYVPRRTLVGAVDGYGNALDTFDATTFPKGSLVDRLITDACAWVLLAATPTEALYPSALAAAAMRVAALVELTYPDNGSDVNVAKDLLAQADAMRRDLAAAAVAAGGDDPATTADDLLPVWSFPAAVSYGDYDL